jgi:ferredoxin
VSLQIRVDPIACEAHGLCAELLPERITLDEWGYPIIDGRPVDGDLAELARQAVDACPTLALHLLGASDAAPRAPARSGPRRLEPRAPEAGERRPRR